MYVESTSRIFTHSICYNKHMFTKDKQNKTPLHRIAQVNTTHIISLLKMLNTQPRWQLWITPSRKPDRVWLNNAGLPLNKSVCIRAMEKNITRLTVNALNTGNFSIVTMLITHPLTEHEYHQLYQASMKGNAFTLIFITNKTYQIADLLRPLIIH